MKTYDVIILGAGAAGLMCAATAAARGRRVAVLDHANKAGKKILLSGGGRCNFTNRYASPKQFLSNNPHFCVSALKRYTALDFEAGVQKAGIAYHEKTLGQLFCDDSSRDILELCLDACAETGVEIFLETQIEKIERHEASVNAASLRKNCQEQFLTSEASLKGEAQGLSRVTHAQHATVAIHPKKKQPGSPRPDGARDDSHSAFRIQTNRGVFETPSLVVATGGLSFPSMGASPFGYKIAEQFGLKVTPVRAALVPLTLHVKDLEVLSPLSGVSLPVEVSCNGATFREALLFTHRGLSGPAILQVSSYFNSGNIIKINLLPEIDNVLDYLEMKRAERPKSELKTILSECMPARLADTFCTHFLTNKPMNQHNDKELAAIAQALTHWQLQPNGTEGYRTAEVTLGGVDTDEISSKTFESKKLPGLYFIGEVLDVTGHLGGFNFQWAWSSGWCCGQFV